MSTIKLRVYEKAGIGQNSVLEKSFNTVATAKRYFKRNCVNNNKTLAYIACKRNISHLNTHTYDTVWKLENSKRWAYIGM